MFCLSAAIGGLHQYLPARDVSPGKSGVILYNLSSITMNSRSLAAQRGFLKCRSTGKCSVFSRTLPTPDSVRDR